jgi:uncharacterized protein YfaS (alpha-2-macroglobulin family)
MKKITTADIARHARATTEKCSKAVERSRAWWRGLPRKHKYGAVTTAILAVLIGLVTWVLLNSGPHLRVATVSVTAPDLSAVVEGKLRPKPAYIRFSLEPPARGRKYLAMPEGNPIARLDLVGKRVTTQITMTPFHAGDWTWQDERTLKFEPTEDWPAGEKFKIRLAPELFASYVEIADLSPSFKTLPFTGTLENFRFYQDPTQRSVRKAVGTLKFSHPVDPAALQAAIKLRMREDGATVLSDAKDVAFTVDFDSVRREAYVHSTPLELPEKQNYIKLTVDKNLKPERGPARLEQELEAEAVIPDLASFFKVESINADIVRNQEGEPEQTLLFDFTDRVHSERFVQQISVWLLPRNAKLPDGRISENYRWESPRQITPEVLSFATRVNLQANPTEDAHADVQSFRFDEVENRYLYIKIEKGLESESGFVIRDGYDTVLPVPSYPKEVNIAHKGALLPLTGERRVTFVSRGVETLKVEVGRLVPGQVNHLVSQTSGDMGAPYFQHYNFDEDNITERFEKFISLASEHPKKAVYSSLNLDEYLPYEGAGRGMFFVRVQGWDAVRKRAIGEQQRRFVLLTDLGLLTKRNADGSHEIFVQSLSSGRPVAYATIELLGKNGVPVLSGHTDDEGHLRLGAAGDFKREKEPGVFLARHGNDVAFMPYNNSSRQLQLSGFDIGGEHSNMHRDAARRVRAFMFSERGIYRPGDGVHLGMVVQREDWRSLAGLPVEFTIVDPRGNTAVRQKLNVPEDGFLTHDYATHEASPTGEYQASLNLLTHRGHVDHQIGSVSFDVEEFQPDTMRIRAAIESAVGKAWVKPGLIEAEVKLENLFGLPAQDRRVAGDWSLQPAALYFPDYNGYRFEDPMRGRRTTVSGVSGRLEDLRSDKEGKALLEVELGRYDEGIYRLELNTYGFEPGDGRSVHADASVMVSPLDHVIGWKTDGDTDWLPRASERNVELIALGQDGKPLTLQDLKLRLVERRYISTLVRQNDGTYAYQSTLKEEVRAEEAFKLAAKGVSRRLDTATPGEYALSLLDADGVELARVLYSVIGEANLAGRLEKEAELEMKLEGDDFAPGDTIEMQITAPYAGTGLITIERDRVYSWKWFSAGAERSVQSITVPEGVDGNAYVNVAFMRDINSPEVFTSPLSYAVAPFSVDRSGRKVGITLKAAAKVKPGETLTIGYSASRPARLAVFAVDEGILQVADYRTPDPLAFFFRKKALQVQTAQILDLVMPEYSLMRHIAAIGGDGYAAELLGANLNPFGRKTEPPAVYWAGLVEAGPEQRELVYQVPDYFNGKLRIMAVASALGAVGAAENETIVRGPFVITPSVLTMAAPGDEFEVSVGVSNALEGSGPDAQVEVSVVPSEHLQVVGEARTKLKISEGDEGRAQFRIKALDALGSASLTFAAHSGAVGVTRKATLSVRPPVSFETTTQAGFKQGGKAELALARSLRPEFSEQRAAASASPLALADGLVKYLEKFPHGCSEQLVSRVFPNLGLADAAIYPVDNERLREDIENVVLQLRSRQSADGGFRFWPGIGESAPFPSIYVMHFLTDARRLALPAPEDMISSGMNYLQEIAAANADTMESARLRAYAIYLLTRNGEITTNFLTHLHESLDKNYKGKWENDLVAVYMASTYRLLQHTDLAQSLIRNYKMSPVDKGWYSDFDTQLGRDSMYLYFVARHFPERIADISAQSLEAITKPVFTGEYNTLSASYAALGLGAYTAAQAQTGVLGTVTVGGKDAAGKPVTVEVAPAQLARATLPHALRTATFSSEVAPGIFYVLTQAGFDTELPRAAVSEGLEIHREYLDAGGSTVSRAKIGDELTVRLRVRSTGEYRSNVAIIDLLPGGFEVIRDSMRDDYSGGYPSHDTQEEAQDYEEGDAEEYAEHDAEVYQDQWRMDYRDIREDRVVIYGGFAGQMTEIKYKVKVTSAGRFTVPSATASAMYDRKVRARSAGDSFEVSRAE